MDPNLKHPRVDETSLGFERAITNDIRLSVTGIYRDNKNAIGSVNPPARWSPTTATDGLGQTQNLYRWTNVAASETSQIITNPDGFQFLDPSGNVLGTVDTTKRYKALMFVASKRFTNRWQAQVSYVLSKAYGSVDNTSEGVVRGQQLDQRRRRHPPIRDPQPHPGQLQRRAHQQPAPRAEGDVRGPDPRDRDRVQRLLPWAERPARTHRSSSSPPA